MTKATEYCGVAFPMWQCPRLWTTQLADISCHLIVLNTSVINLTFLIYNITNYLVGQLFKRPIISLSNLICHSSVHLISPHNLLNYFRSHHNLKFMTHNINIVQSPVISKFVISRVYNLCSNYFTSQKWLLTKIEWPAS